MPKLRRNDRHLPNRVCKTRVRRFGSGRCFVEALPGPPWLRRAKGRLAYAEARRASLQGHYLGDLHFALARDGLHLDPPRLRSVSAQADIVTIPGLGTPTSFHSLLDNERRQGLLR
jgi:hypothetical protein